MQEKNSWYDALVLVERLNRSVKEPGWNSSDVQRVYEIKDQFLKLLLEKKPEDVEISLFYCPYMRYSERTKNLAGEMMRADGKRFSFEFYLQQVQPCELDLEDPLRATIEAIATCQGQSFSFHLPLSLLPASYDVHSIPRKAWVPAREFHHQQLVTAEERFQTWFDEMC